MSVLYDRMGFMPRLGSGIPLIGRDAELGQLRAGLERTRAGDPAAVLVSGDAGVGKTRLLGELSEEARAAGALVLTGRCLDIAEHGLPYLAFADALGPLAVHGDTAIAGAVQGRRALGRLLPQVSGGSPMLAERSPGPVEQDSSGRARPELDLGQLQLFDAVLGLLTELSEHRAVVLIIEDLHWADGATRDLLSFLLSRTRQGRLMIVASYRREDVHRAHPLRPVLAQLARLPIVERLELEPFDEYDTRAFIDALAEVPLKPELITSIVRRGEGNAFFTEELIASCIECEGIPDALVDVLLARLERLSSDAQRVVRVVSVADGGASHKALLEVAGLAEAELEEALREAVAHHVLVISPDHYSFRHALLREAVYHDLLPGERVRIHATYGKRLMGLTGGRVAALLAYHSLESNDLPTALEASLRAADEAERRGAPSSALRAIEQALRIWDAVPPEQRPTDTDELALLKEASYFAGTSGEPERAIAYARSAVKQLDRITGITPERAAAIWRRLALALITTNSAENESPSAIERAWELLADAAPSTTRAWVLATRAILLRAINQPEAAAVSARAAVADARAAGAPGAEADALCTLAALAQGKGDVAEARELLADALPKARGAGALTVELRARYFLGLTHDDDAEYDKALAVYQEAIERARESGLLSSGYGLELRAHALYLRYVTGDWPADGPSVLDHGAPVLAAHRMAGAGVHLLIARGRFDDAQRVIDDLRAAWRTDLGIARSAGAAATELAEWRGDHVAAMRFAEEAIGWLNEYEQWLLAGIRIGALGIGSAARAAEAARRRLDVDGESRAIATGDGLLTHVRECAERGATRGASLGPEGLAWLARAEAEGSGLRGASDPGLWEHAVNAFDHGAVYEQALCALRHAEALLAGPRSPETADRAGERLAQVHAVAERLGAEPLLGAVRDLARRARIALPGEAPPRTMVDPLTARERAVLERVALGLTNRQVGEDLYISEKTVSVHLSRVMAKLGASRRAEAVAIAYDRGLLAVPDRS